jgi:hypothetical protein
MENWNEKEFEKIKKWAIGQKSNLPEFENLWEEIYSPRKTTEELISEVNGIKEKI